MKRHALFLGYTITTFFERLTFVRSLIITSQRFRGDWAVGERTSTILRALLQWRGSIARSFFLVLLLQCFVFVSASDAQISQPPALNGPSGDTTHGVHHKIKQVRPGFDLPDSLYIARDSVRGDLDTIIQYTAKDSIVFDVAHKKMILVDDATMNFQTRELDAYEIIMDFQNNTMTAFSSSYDSAITNALRRTRRIIRDTNRVKSRGAPILKDAATPYEGELIVYNFKTKHGTVRLGTTEMEGGFYYGEKIKQVDNRTLFVENGRFTTCDAPVPHYFFASPKMKVVLQSQVFAEPVYLYIADVPILALPFGVFPNHAGGRRSGIIAPNYQTTGDRGYGLTHLGYYQIFSDYFDAALQSDIYTKGGYNIDFIAKYMKRYLLGGASSLEVAYGKTRFNSVDPFQENWLLRGALPNLALGLFSSLSANVSFQNANYYRNNAKTINDLLTQQVNSNASYTTSWEDLGLSLGIDYNRSQNLVNNTYTEESPSFNLNKSTFYPFAPPSDAEGIVTPSVWQTLAISYSMNGARQVARTSIGDTLFPTTEKYGLLHSPSISIAPKFSHFTFSPSFSYQEAWFVRKLQRNFFLVNDSTEGHTDTYVNGFHRVYSYNMGVGVSTTLYGTANIGAFGIKAIRHTVQPSVGFSYHPDLSNQEITSYIDPLTRQPQQYDIFEGEINGGLASGHKSGNLNFGLDNDFEAKVEHQVTKDSTSESKVKLLHFTASTGYDIIQKLLGGLSMSAYSNIGANLNVSANASYSFYPAKQGTTADSTDHTLISLKQGFLRALSATVGLGGSISSVQTTEGENYDSLRRLVNVTSPDDERAMLLGGYYPGYFVSVPFRPKWNISYGFTYNESYAINQTVRNFSANANLTLGLTRNWAITTSAAYDLIGKQIIVPNIRVHRDLHCWEMNFDYRPTGLIRGFNFEIRIKAPQLQDIKLTRTENSYGQF